MRRGVWSGFIEHKPNQEVMHWHGSPLQTVKLFALVKIHWKTALSQHPAQRTIRLFRVKFDWRHSSQLGRPLTWHGRGNQSSAKNKYSTMGTAESGRMEQKNACEMSLIGMGSCLYQAIANKWILQICHYCFNRSTYSPASVPSHAGARIGAHRTTESIQKCICAHLYVCIAYMVLHKLSIHVVQLSPAAVCIW